MRVLDARARARRRAAASVVLLVLAAALAACGAREEVAEVRPWPSEPPYLPPPDPAAYATDATDPPARPRDAGSEPVGDAGAPSDEQVRRDLEEAFGEDAIDRASLTPDGLATVPPSAPGRLEALIRGANEVARKPYVYGGGHGRAANEIWIDTAYDCSGSISFALAAAGFIDAPMDSGSLSRWGRPGPGRYVTIYANAGHAFMTVAGLRFDTSGRRERGSRWQDTGRGAGGFVVRHPPGL